MSQNGKLKGRTTRIGGLPDDVICDLPGWKGFEDVRFRMKKNELTEIGIGFSKFDCRGCFDEVFDQISAIVYGWADFKV